MPRRLTQTKPGTHQAMKNTSYESMVVSWLMQVDILPHLRT